MGAEGRAQLEAQFSEGSGHYLGYSQQPQGGDQSLGCLGLLGKELEGSKSTAERTEKGEEVQSPGKQVIVFGYNNTFKSYDYCVHFLEKIDQVYRIRKPVLMVGCIINNNEQDFAIESQRPSVPR